MAAQLRKVVPTPVSGRRGPLAHSGNGFKPVCHFIATLKGREKAYAQAAFNYAIRTHTTTKPECTLPEDRARLIHATLFNFFSTEDRS